MWKTIKTNAVSLVLQMLWVRGCASEGLTYRCVPLLWHSQLQADVGEANCTAEVACGLDNGQQMTVVFPPHSAHFTIPPALPGSCQSIEHGTHQSLFTRSWLRCSVVSRFFSKAMTGETVARVPAWCLRGATGGDMSTGRPAPPSSPALRKWKA